MENIRAAYAAGADVKECMRRFNVQMSYILMLRRMKAAGIVVRHKRRTINVRHFERRTAHARPDLVEHYVPRRVVIDHLPVSSFAFPNQIDARRRAMAGR